MPTRGTRAVTRQRGWPWQMPAALGFGLLALSLWWLAAGFGQNKAEPFRSFENLSGFSNEQVWSAYRFAVANPLNVLNYMPCFCGCLYHGDKNNRDCYIDSIDSLGSPVFDSHAAG